MKHRHIGLQKPWLIRQFSAPELLRRLLRKCPTIMTLASILAVGSRDDRNLVYTPAYKLEAAVQSLFGLLNIRSERCNALAKLNAVMLRCSGHSEDTINWLGHHGWSVTHPTVNSVLERLYR
jgi:hypothetical protein